jgi:hypothetical protein
LLSFAIVWHILKECGHNLSRGVHLQREQYGLYGKEEKTIMAREKSHNNTILIYGMAIYGKCPYYFGSPETDYLL